MTSGPQGQADGSAIQLADVTCSRADDLWTEVLRRQPGEVAWFANHPADPSAN